MHQWKWSIDLVLPQDVSLPATDGSQSCGDHILPQDNTHIAVLATQSNVWTLRYDNNWGGQIRFEVSSVGGMVERALAVGGMLDRHGSDMGGMIEEGMLTLNMEYNNYYNLYQ